MTKEQRGRLCTSLSLYIYILPLVIVLFLLHHSKVYDCVHLPAKKCTSKVFHSGVDVYHQPAADVAATPAWVLLSSSATCRLWNTIHPSSIQICAILSHSKLALKNTNTSWCTFFSRCLFLPCFFCFFSFSCFLPSPPPLFIFLFISASITSLPFLSRLSLHPSFG